jgi:hypothetical protein
MKNFINSTIFILATTALLKLITISGEAKGLSRPDVLLSFLTSRQLMLLVASLEIVVIFRLLSSQLTGIKLYLIAMLGMSFLYYKFALFQIGYRQSCGCLGRVHEWLGISEHFVALISSALAAYMLIGSFICLFRAMNNQRTREQFVINNNIFKNNAL